MFKRVKKFPNAEHDLVSLTHVIVKILLTEPLNIRKINFLNFGVMNSSFETKRKMKNSLSLVVLVIRLKINDDLVSFVFVIMTVIELSCQLYYLLLVACLFHDQYDDISSLLSVIYVLCTRHQRNFERFVIKVIFTDNRYFIR